MSYLALYRRFRPDNFSKVIGQEAIVTTLTNQIKSDKIGHAYLFCGARGTGKTTLAKIFAKAVNCLDTVDGSPCGKCEACLNLQNPANLNVIEMDAASNNKVENVRTIRENVQFPPVGVKYKVYIIDEVHMLTTEAFNALLKTLEEPPKHAIFVLATTEPHKLPATILSRCMRFYFRLVSTDKIASLVGDIYDEIGKKYTKEAVRQIAKAGEGSVRDALSVADLCVSVGDGELNYNDVLTVLGATDTAKTDALMKAVLTGNAGGVLALVDELASLGKSIGLISKDLVNYTRDLTVIKTVKNANDVLCIPNDIYESLYETSKLTTERGLLRVLEIFSQIENDLRYSTMPRSVLETALIKASMPEVDYNIDALLARITKLETAFKSVLEKGSVTVNNVASNDNSELKNQINALKTELELLKNNAKSEPIKV
ncbi:MAG: DNA polymerase III subunit gamma/tau, partial [Clostridia bacterium]|nr:DNA polymerase III subunit gamma/tau [Clostridia bacterium]